MGELSLCMSEDQRVPLLLLVNGVKMGIEEGEEEEHESKRLNLILRLMS